MSDGTMASYPDPVLYVYEVQRRYKEGREGTLDILRGASLAVWAGQSVALVAPSGTESRHCCTSRGFWKSRMLARSTYHRVER